MWLTITLLAIIVALFYQYYRNTYVYWQRRGVPHEKPLPFVGNMRGIGTKLHFRDLNLRLYKRYKGTAPFVGFFFFFKRAALLLDLDLVKQVLIKDFANFPDRGLYNNVEDDPLTGHLVNIEGEPWRAMRHKLTPVFTSGKMKLMFASVVQVGERFLQAVELAAKASTEQPPELKELCARFTTDVIGTCVFGLECNSLNDPNAEFRRKGRDIFERPRHPQFVQAFIQTNPALARRLHLKLFSDDVSEFFMSAVEKTMAYRVKNNVKRNDFLDMMIEMRAKDEALAKEGGGIDLSHGLTFHQIVAQAFVFFVAGFETSSSTMSFCLYELAQDQDIQDKLRAEIRSVLEAHKGVLSYEAMQEMHYLEQVVAETLRLHSIVPQLIRRTTDDYRVPNTNLVIESGTNVVVPVDAIHLDPEIYPDPQRFDPTRFEPAAIEARHSCSYLPFGDGPRNCIGLRFGKMQTKIGLIFLLKDLKFSVSKHTEIPLQLDNRTFTLSPKNGIYLTIEKI